MAHSSGLPRTPGVYPYVFPKPDPPRSKDLRDLKKSAESVVEGTYFNVTEVQKLLLFMWKVSPSSKSLDRTQFRQFVHCIFGITDDIIQDRVFRMFDKNHDGNLNGAEWVRGISLMMRGTHEEKAKIVFEVYDLQDDGVITREEIFSFLRNSLVKLPDDEDKNEVVHDLVEMAHLKLDVDRDGTISLKDFQDATRKEKLLLQCLGRCLPKPGAVTTFSGLLSQFDSQVLH